MGFVTDRLFTDLKDEWPERLESINQTQKFLYIASYYIVHDKYGIEFIEALLSAAKRGVRIYVLIDSFATKLAENMLTDLQNQKLQEALTLLRKHNITVISYKPKSYFRRICGGGSHIKFQINDRAEVFISSGNITVHSYDMWKDISLSMSGKIAAEILYLCKEYFTDEILNDIEYLNTAKNQGISYQIFYNNPNKDCKTTNIIFNNYNNSITNRISEIIDSANQALLLSSFYFKPNRLIVSALLKAAKRGVRISIIHSHISALKCSELPWFSCLKTLKSLLKYDLVDIYEDLGGQHSKYIVCDNEKILIGSYNFEHAAHDMLSELMFETSDKNLIEQINNFHSKEINKDGIIKLDSIYLDKIYKRIRFKYWFLRPILRFL